MKTDNYMVTEIDRQHMARELFDQLARHGNTWVAVRTDGHGWEIVKPRSQEAILAACATDESDKAVRDELVPVEQVDRDAAADLYLALDGDLPTRGIIEEADRHRRGNYDHSAAVQAFAAHRIAARAEAVAEVVAWLRDSHDGKLVSNMWLADTIVLCPNCHRIEHERGGAD